MIGQYGPTPIPGVPAPVPVPGAPGPKPIPGPQGNVLACYGVDTKLFAEKCRLPLLPGDWNVWEIWRTNRDGATWKEGLENPGPTGQRPDGATWGPLLPGQVPGLKYVLHWWLEKNTWLPTWKKDFDNLIVAASPASTAIIQGKTYQVSDLMGTQIAASNDREHTKCSPYFISVPELAGGSVLKYYVAFIYRGNKTSIPWPVYRFEDFGLASLWETHCPVAADFAVMKVWRAPAAIPRPEKPSVFPELPKPPAIIDPRKTLTGLAFWGGVGVFAAAILADRIMK